MPRPRSPADGGGQAFTAAGGTGRSRSAGPARSPPKLRVGWNLLMIWVKYALKQVKFRMVYFGVDFFSSSPEISMERQHDLEIPCWVLSSGPNDLHSFHSKRIANSCVFCLKIM